MSSDNVQACHVCDLLPNVHTCLPSQPGEAFCTGQYLYYHYGCDGLDDRGWGCGYRTVQTICSWVRQHRLSVSATSNSLKHSPVPSIAQIQQMLVEMGDKSQSFVNSRQWIGSFEACLILDHIYQDPHYFGKRPTLEILQNTGYVRWMPVHELHADTFYNMCLPKEPFS
uniref:UFSP1/2/DUB catalytic domain-containing protein n=1 Tax=Arion vulgaris TaxID=1028688 RepID=A0A0B6YRC5_9EUPU